MKTQYIHSAHEFLELAGDNLLVDEIRHSLAFGIAERVICDSHVFGPENPWFIAIEDAGQLCATAIRTPPHRPILSYLSGDLEILSSKLTLSIHNVDPSIPGIVGDKEIADLFTQQWCATYGTKVVDVMAQRIYKLTELIKPKFADGGLRQANLSDEEMVISWATAFQKEAIGDVPSRNHRLRHQERIRERIRNGDIYFWDNVVPKSMAIKTRPTRSGISIGGVYTPPENRNHGYATSCVASLCEEVLSKHDFCVLYTDLSNPVSNSIYKRIGFNEYSDSVQYTYLQE